ncbi:hypothetical protein [Flavobacterium sp.]|uniref:hypothetical protein n=1 Tax=Flavobacterium sp. TaxID=239 RepID=UPI002639566E|nr:hypothetical protein [Flavobacterium sp.]
MSKIIEYYNKLLEVYTGEIIYFENEKDRVNKEESPHSVRWEPKAVINTRMFHFDEWLTNPYHNYFCYEQKKKILPLLIEFISAYNQLTDNEKEEFEQERTKNKYQEYLDELWKPKLNFISVLDALKKERQNLKETFDYPSKPSRPNAHRQWEEYDKKIKEYWKKVEVEDNCIKEISDWKNIYESIKL